MARRPRVCPPGVPQHIIQRGNNRQVCFASDEDLATYANWLDEAARKYGVSLHAWVFMSNHVHLLATPSEPDSLSRMMQTLGRRYVRYFNHVYDRTGTLWEGRFRSCLVDAESYLLVCQRYIELNPVRAGMAAHPGEYRWSSYAANARGVQMALWTPHDIWRRLGTGNVQRAARYRSTFRGHIDTEQLAVIRTTVNKGLALGDERFRQEIERLTGVRVSPARPGRKPTKEKVPGDQRELLL